MLHSQAEQYAGELLDISWRIAARKPIVALQLSTKRVITMEWIEGCRVNDQTALLQASMRPQDVAVLLLDAFAEMTYVHGFVHGDPHPGNILVRPAPHQGQAFSLYLAHLLAHSLTHSLRLQLLWVQQVTRHPVLSSWRTRHAYITHVAANRRLLSAP